MSKSTPSSEEETLWEDDSSEAEVAWLEEEVWREELSVDSAEDWLKLDELCFEEFELDWLEGELPQEAKARTETTRGRNFLVFMPLMLMPKRRIKKTALGGLRYDLSYLPWDLASFLLKRSIRPS